MRIILKALKYFILSAAVITAAAVVFVETGYFKGLLKNLLIAQLTPLTGGTFSVEKLSGNVFTGVALQGVRVSGSGGQFFYVEKIDVSYSLLALIAGKMYFTEVVVSKPFFSIAQDAAGRWSYEGLFQTSKSGSGASVVVREVRINDGRFSMKYWNKPATIDITGVSLSASAGIIGDTADITINALGAKSTKPNLEIKGLSGNLRLKGPDLNIKKLLVSTAYSKASIDGTVTNLVNPVFNLNIDCPKISLKDIGALIPGIRPAGGPAGSGPAGEEPEGGALSSNIKVTGSLDELKVVQSLEYKSLRMYNDVIFRSGVPSVALNSRIRGLDLCDIMPVLKEYESKTCPAGELSLDVSARAKGRNFGELSSRVSVNIHHSIVAGYSVEESSLTAVINGRFVSLDGELEIARERFDISVLGSAKNNAFRLDKLKIQSAAELAFASTGVLGYNEDGPLDISFSLNSAGLDLVSIFLPEVKMQGVISSTGTLKGTMGSPGIAAELDGSDIAFSGFSAESVKAKIALNGFKFPPDGTADVWISGFRAGGTGFDKIFVHAQNRERINRVYLSAIKTPAVKIIAEAGVTEKSKGVYSVDISKMNVSAGTSTWSNDGNVRIEASAKQVQIQALRMLNGRQLISAKGDIGIVKNMNMKVSVEHVDIRCINAFSGLDIPLGGTLDANLGVEGNYLSPRITGTIDLKDASAGGISFDNIPASLNYAEKNLRFETRAEKDGKTLFEASGTVPVDLSFGPVKDRIGREGLRVAVKSGLGLDIVPMLTEQVKTSSGKVQADILLEGDPLLPQIHGNINIAGGSLSLLSMGADYQNINASIVLNGNEIVVAGLTLKSGNGSAKLTGKIMMKGFIPTDSELGLNCRNFNIMSTGIFTGSIDADVKIKGLYASGSVTVKEGTVNIPSDSRIDIKEVEFVQTGPDGGTVPSASAAADPLLYKLLSLDIRLLVPGKVWINGPGVTTEINGELNVTKERNGPVAYSGEIDSIRGIYKLNGRPLTITEGKVVSKGSNFTASLISAKASCKVGDFSIDVILGGTIDKPIITFQSEPPLERNEIISYLAFGVPSSNLSQPQSSSLQNTSFDLVAGLTENDIKGVVGRVVPLDELTLKPSEGSWGVGKNITDKLTAKYEWRTGLDESPQTVLDYRLDRHYSLDSMIGDPKTAGVDLFWKIGY